MTTLTQIVTKAFRETGIVEVGGSPDTDEVAEGLSLLQSIIPSLIHNELGENLTDVNLGSASTLNSYGKATDASVEITSLYVPNNVRLIGNLTAPITIYLHPKPRSGNQVSIRDVSGNFATFPMTIQGNGRLINNGTSTAASQVMNTNSGTLDLFYRGDLGQWTVVDVSSGAVASPFPTVYDDLLILTLAKRLSPRFGGEWDDVSETELRRLVRNFRAEYRQETPTHSEYALIRLPSITNGTYSFGSSSDRFNKGLI